MARGVGAVRGHHGRERVRRRHVDPNVLSRIDTAPSHRHLYAQSLVFHTNVVFAQLTECCFLMVRYAEIASAHSLFKYHYYDLRERAK